jgi:succinate-semialdehyde dehydrogenase/glutarate-semialdehyde dehydrogenase
MNEIISPLNHQILAPLNYISDKTLQEKLQNENQVQKDWMSLHLEKKIQLFENLKNTIQEQLGPLSNLIHQEMGKSLSEAQAELKKCLDVVSYYQQKAPYLLKAKKIDSPDPSLDISISYQPLGAILAIMPWNFPWWQVFRFAPAAMLAGNTVFLKHAPQTTLSALEIEKVFFKSGFPVGVFQTLVINHNQVESLISHQQIRAVTFTGSTSTGKKIAKLAGQQLKKCVLELGGSDSFIVCHDADLEYSIQWAIRSRLICSGQSCIAAKRFFIHQSLYENFCDHLIKKVKEIKEIAPLAQFSYHNELKMMVHDALEKGAKLCFQSSPSTEFQNHYPIQIIKDVSDDSLLLTQESFGPIFALTSFQTDDEVISRTNKSPYGLSAAIFSANQANAKKMLQQIHSGNGFINQMSMSAPFYPFGGTKESGLGRELGSYGILEFVNHQTLVINTTSAENQ